MRTYRVIQWATGNVGKHALRTIVGRPDFELVGVRTYDPAKVGRDAAELVGGPPTGVVMTDDVDAILALDADCVSYCPLATSTGSLDEALDDLCRILASGKNVVGPAMAYYMYPPLVAGMATPDGFARLQAACAEGATTIHIAGVGPGFTPDYVPLALTRASRVVEHLEITELVDLRDYTSRKVLNEYMGFGMPLDHDPLFFRQLADVYNSPYFLAMRMLGDSIGVEFDDVTWEVERALAPEEFEAAAGTFPAGGVAGVRGELVGWRAGRRVVTMIFYWQLLSGVNPDWPAGDGRWHIRITGDPSIEADLAVTTELDTGRAVSIVSANVPLNAIPSVVAAAPGIATHFDLAFVGGGYYAADDPLAPERAG